MKIENEKLQRLNERYHTMVRQGKDTSNVQSDIKSIVNQYINDTNGKLNDIREKHHTIEQKIISHEKVTRQDYDMLINLYRKSRELMNDISSLKKKIREMKT